MSSTTDATDLCPHDHNFCPSIATSDGNCGPGRCARHRLAIDEGVWARVTREIYRELGEEPPCPSCAEKDAEIERLTADASKFFDAYSDACAVIQHAKEWLTDMNARVNRLQLDYDRNVAIGGWLAELQRILRGEG